MPSRVFDYLDASAVTPDRNVAFVNDAVSGSSYVTLRRVGTGLLFDLIATGDGSLASFSVTIGKGNLKPGTISILIDNVVVAADDGAGVFTASGSPPPNATTGTVDYDTGAAVLTMAAAPVSGGLITVKYNSYRSIGAAEGGAYEKGDIVFPNTLGEGITELFGFKSREGHWYARLEVGVDDFGSKQYLDDLDANFAKQKDSAVKYQVSVDGGTTWQYWNTASPASWQTGSSADATFSTEEEIAAGISALLFSSASGAKQFRLKARLFPTADAKESPRLYWSALFFEHSFDPEEDLIRSLDSYLSTNLRVREVMRFNLTGDTAVTLDASEGDETIEYSGVIAYNLTDDPGRTTPLALTQGVPSSSITLAVAQVGVVEFIALATVPVSVRADSFTQLSTSRSVVITVPQTTVVGEYEGYPRLDDGEAGQGLVGLVKEPVGYPINAYRVRPPPSMVAFSVGLFAQSPRERQALAIQSAIRKLLDDRPVFDSVGTTERYVRAVGGDVTLGSGTAALAALALDNVALGLSVKNQQASFLLWAQEGGYDTVESVQVVDMRMILHPPDSVRDAFACVESIEVGVNDIREGL